MISLRTLGAAGALSLAAFAAPLSAQESGPAAAAPAATAQTPISGTATAQPRRESSRRSRDHLAGDEIHAAPQNNMLEVLRALRPRWIRERGDQNFQGNNGIKVYVDGILVGEIGELRSLDPKTVTAAEFMSPQDATTRYGSDHTRGAIMLSTRTQS